MNFTDNDLRQLSQRGIDPHTVEEQLRMFAEGFPVLHIKAPATTRNKGVRRLLLTEQEHYIRLWEDYVAQGHDISKFVPASGAASRMFKDLFAFLDDETQGDTPTSPHVQEFLRELHKFAFANLLKGKTGREAVRCLLQDQHYGSLPKGLLAFHAYRYEVRTPALEHLVEAARVMNTSTQPIRVHFTVSHEHLPLFRQHIAENMMRYQRSYGVTFEVTFSEQSPATDTIAANPDGTPFRQSDGSLLFRPGGHGALIQNLEALNQDIVFIKNIDNVVPDRLKRQTVRWKKILGGVLVEEMQRVQQVLNNPDVTPSERQQLLRPIRVCGVVRNTGEPGGGPFLVQEKDGSISRQILESSQIPDPKMLQQSRYFNPVDLVCALRDPNGKPYRLQQFVDPDTGFISHKSKDGRELLALELPGLWNGAMARWNTLFVEVPESTFNPVKTVNDLLRKQHQPER